MTDTATTTQNRTHVRIVNDGAPVLITARTALDEMNAVQMDKAVRRTVRTASSTHQSKGMVITYTNGDVVRIRPATPEDVEDLDPNPVDVPKMTPLMVKVLRGAARNPGGAYAKNIGAYHATTGKAAGTSGALLRRGLIERRTEGVQGDGYYVTTYGLRVAAALEAGK